MPDHATETPMIPPNWNITVPLIGMTIGDLRLIVQYWGLRPDDELIDFDFDDYSCPPVVVGIKVC